MASMRCPPWSLPELRAGKMGPRSAKLPARILIADDNSVARTTIRALLDWHSFQICGEATNGKEAIERVVELKPDSTLICRN